MNIIPLGMNCEIAGFIVDNKIVKNKKEGRKTLPFDLMLSNYSGICNLFESNDSLKTLLDVEIIKNEENQGYKNQKDIFLYSDSANAPYGDLIVNTKLGFVFNHESPGNPSLHHIEKWPSKNYFSSDNLKIFKQRYTQRYNNMIDNIAKNNVIFVLSSFVWPKKLEKILETKYPNLNFKIFVYKPLNNMYDFYHNLKIRFPHIKEENDKLTNYKLGHKEGRIKYITLNSLLQYKCNTQQKIF